MLFAMTRLVMYELQLAMALIDASICVLPKAKALGFSVRQKSVSSQISNAPWAVHITEVVGGMGGGIGGIGVVGGGTVMTFRQLAGKSEPGQGAAARSIRQAS